MGALVKGTPSYNRWHRPCSCGLENLADFSSKGGFQFGPDDPMRLTRSAPKYQSIRRKPQVLR